MTEYRFSMRWALAAMVVMLSSPIAIAQTAEKPAAVDPKPADAEPSPKAGKLISTGDVLSGELNAMRGPGGKKGKRIASYQITSEARRLPPPNGLCGLETGPETFQLITSSDAQAAQLKSFIGKEMSIKVDEVACAQDAGQMSEAVITKWSVVAKP